MTEKKLTRFHARLEQSLDVATNEEVDSHDGTQRAGT